MMPLMLIPCDFAYSVVSTVEFIVPSSDEATIIMSRFNDSITSGSNIFLSSSLNGQAIPPAPSTIT